MTDPRDAYIARVVGGKSFADVGGLWGTINEKVSVAHCNGAMQLTMIDVSAPGHRLWQLFEERRRALGLPEVSCISADIVQLAETSECPQFDVVHCSGVLYHVPDPMRFLAALRRVTREYLVLTTAVTATKVTSAAGNLEVPSTACLFLPALQGEERRVVDSYWRQFVGDAAMGLTQQIAAWDVEDFAPWWWLPTVDALKGMCRASGFAYVEGTHAWNNNAYTLLLSPVR